MNKEKLKLELKEISELEENWDGYGAEPIKKEIINQTNDIIDFLDESVPDFNIVPNVHGIQLEWENDPKALEIYIEDDGLSYLQVVGKEMKDWIETGFSDINKINKLLEWLYS